jgi:beta-galactosidase/beta-glucuronidase
MTPPPPDHAYHPRPQLRREQWIDLNGPWGFAYDDADVGVAERWFARADVFDRVIQVPYPPESRASGVGDTRRRPVVWYRRTVDVAPQDRPVRLQLHFGAVDYHAQVWVNGHLAVEHEGGHTPFSADIAPFLQPGPEQVIVVRAFDDADDLGQPRGKQYWEVEPKAIWYHRTSGIWQPVWMEPLPALGVESLRLTPDFRRSAVDVTVRLNRRPERPLRVRLTLHGDRDRRVLADDLIRVDAGEVRREIRLDADMARRRSRALTWTPAFPRLIDLTVELLDENGDVLDRVASYFGLRSIEVTDGRFVLNGVPTFMRLVLGQNYWPDTLLAADDGTLQREVELIKALGFNGVRIHQKIENPRFLYWCDRLGVMVWGEAANAYVFDDQAARRLTNEWLQALERDYNHPCIVAWVPLNESWGVPDLDTDPAQRAFVAGLYHLTKALDPTRPVIGNDGWQHAFGDIFGVHDYAPDGATLTERYGSRAALERTFVEVRPHHYPLLGAKGELADQPVVISEFGGLSFAPEAGQEWFGYDKLADADALLARYRELVTALLDSTVLAGFCYTQLTDTEQETNGLLTVDRRHKLDPEAVRAINTRPSKAVPSEVLDAVLMAEVERRRREREGSPQGGPA